MHNQSRDISGSVIGILSGDSLIVQSEQFDNSLHIQIISLEHLVAPKFGSPDGQILDEPHGYNSWEFMRQICIGKSIIVKPQPQKGQLYRTHPSFGRLQVIFGRVMVYDYTHSQYIDVGLLCVSNGWVRIRSPPNTNSYIQNLINNEYYAKSNKLGIWRQNGFVRKLPVHYDAQHLISVSEYYAIVDSVVNGTTLSLFLLPDHQHIIFRVAACRSPSAKKGQENELGTEAKNFTILKLLHRTIRVRLHSCNESDLFIGPIISSEDTIIRNLISQGLATFNPHTADLTPSFYEYERCEQEAKAKGLKLFERDKSTDELDLSQESNYQTLTGVVQQIIGSCSLKVDVHGETRLIQFNCIKTRDFIPAGGSEVYGLETREFLRKKLIGEKILIKVEGSIENRLYATVFMENDLECCINVLLCQQGYATVIEPFIGKRSEQFQQMQQAEQQAIDEKLGIHHTSLPPYIPHIIDLSITVYPEYSKKYFDELSNKTLSGVIEHILGGNRFIVLTDRYMLRLAVNGLLPIAVSDLNSRLSNEYSIENYLNRDIKFDIHEIDKSGGFLANMYIYDKNKEKLSIAYDLLRHGLADIHKRTIKDIPNYQMLEAAQIEARNRKIGKWKQPTTLPSATVEFSKFVSVRVTRVLSSSVVVVQFLNESMKEISNVLPSATTKLLEPPKIGELVCVSIGDVKYRARVEPDDQLYLIDYDGLIDSVPEKITELPPRLLSIEPQATTVRLAFIQGNNSEKDVKYVEDLIMDKRLYMYVASFTDYPEVFLLDSPELSAGNLNAMVLMNTDSTLGNTTITIDEEFKPLIKSLRNYEKMKKSKS